MNAKARLALALLLAAAAAQYAWNGYSLPPIIGYDATFHAQYIQTIAEEGRLPEPLEGWSTFHPPLYYLVGSLVWPLVRPDDFRDSSQVSLWMFGLRAISGVAMLLVGGISFHLVLRLTGSLVITIVASALVLFIPCAALAASMVGNEAWGVAMAALCLPALLRLQQDPGDLRAAALAGLTAGLALATKFTGLFVAGACLVPFLRRGIEQRVLRAMLVGGVLGALVAGPVYVRNLYLTGSPVPMTRTLEPMKSAEAKFVIRERRLADYLWIDPAALWRPSLYHVKDKPGDRENRNPAMTNIWGLAYAGMWYDSFGHRVPGALHVDGEYAGPVMTILGIVPSVLMVFGFVLALRDWIRRKSASEQAPLVAMSLIGLATFLAFTWRAPSAAAVKASYLLPLLGPAALFYARGIQAVSPRIRVAALSISIIACLAAAYVFTNGAHYPVLRPSPA